MDYKVILLILALIGVIYMKFRNLIFKAKDTAMSMEAQKLDSEANKLKSNITELKKGLDTPQKNLSAEEIEDYWSKK
jgi:hypothetical protein